MKVGCRQCGASYSVADDKVAGRKLKLRCKKCGEPMVIDASAQDSMPFGPKLQIVTPEPSEPAQGEWFVAVDDRPQGPYSLHEIQSHYAAGLIARDALVFREGLADWTRAQDVPELRASRRPSAAVGGEVEMGSDPFADSVPPFSQPLSPRLSAEELLSGPSREGTVQFSLDDIRALSAISSPSLAPAAPARPGYAGGDGSGLIDVRSLSESAPPPDTFRAISSDLQASPLDTMAPFALPARAQRGGVDFRTKVLAGVASFGFLLMGAVGVLALTRTPPQAEVVPIAGEALPQAAAAAVVGSAPQPATAAAALAAAPSPAAVPAEAPQASGEREPAARSGGTAADAPGRSVKNRRRAPRAAATANDDAARATERSAAKGKSARSGDIDDILAKPAAKEAPAAAKGDDKPGASKGASDDLDALLLGAIDGKKGAAPKPAAEPAESALPKAPSRDQMLTALGKAKAKVARCKGTGVATANITVASTGRVSSVAVSGVDGAAKSCVESAVRSTPFPKFQQPSFAVKFPFKLGG